MDDVTKILRAINLGQTDAMDLLIESVYWELRQIAADKLAHERPGHTLQATALVNEAYLRLFGGGVDQGDRGGCSADDETASSGRSELETHPAGDGDRESSATQWESRGHFFAAAAEAMRRILIDRARSKNSLKRGGDRNRVGIELVDCDVVSPETNILALDEALEKLEQRDPSKAEVVKLRYFAGLTIEQTAQALGVSEPTVKRHWTYARAWLHREMEG